MKRAILGVLLVFLLAAGARAGSVTVKGITVSFDTPAGFVAAEGKYSYLLHPFEENGSEEFPSQFLFISEEDAKAADAGKRGLRKFIHVMGFKSRFTPAEFAGYKFAIRRTAEKAKDRIAGDDKELFGVFVDTDTQLSSLELLGSSRLCAITHMIVGDRLLLVRQYEDAGPAGAQDFKDEAVQRLGDMRFTPSGKEEVDGLFTALAAAAFVLVAGILVYGFFRFRPKSGKGSA